MLYRGALYRQWYVLEVPFIDSDLLYRWLLYRVDLYKHLYVIMVYRGALYRQLYIGALYRHWYVIELPFIDSDMLYTVICYIQVSLTVKCIQIWLKSLLSLVRL